MGEAMKLRTLPLSRANVDRADELRSNATEIAALRERAAFLIFDGEKFQIAQPLSDSASDQSPSGAASAQSPSGAASAQSPVGTAALNVDSIHTDSLDSISLIHPSAPAEIRESYFLGLSRDASAQPFFLARVEATNLPEGSPELSRWKTLREIGAQLSALEIGLAVHGQGLANWHTKHQYCPTCGAKSVPDFAGSIRRCTVDGSEHYPRTDPAIIILLRDSADRILLGRQRIWPEHRFSTFAGFVETGESFEQAIHREVHEEAGVEVDEIEYLGSQPWPFPASLMIAFQARITNPEAARADETEIEEIRWFSRDSMKSAIDDGTLLLPPLISVARAMIESWYHEGEQNKERPPLPGSETWRP